MAQATLCPKLPVIQCPTHLSAGNLSFQKKILHLPFCPHAKNERYTASSGTRGGGGGDVCSFPPTVRVRLLLVLTVREVGERAHGRMEEGRFKFASLIGEGGKRV
jgi:hypothetical protein